MILHNNASPPGTAASLHAFNASKPAGPVIPNVTLLEAPVANREAETDVGDGASVPYPEIVDGCALPQEGPRLRGLAECAERVG